jgi:queuine tRNA-ribosyltransferase
MPVPSYDGIPDFSLRVMADDGGARAGILDTPRGSVLTPCFMPVGTKGTVKAMSPERLKAVGAQVVLANTYHLALRPGSHVVRELGGLHRFMAWDGPILTDSGGYQVFSLRDTARVDDSGAEFQSIYDGSKQVFTPERAMSEQQALGADLIMCLDQCPPGGADESRGPRAGPDAAKSRTRRVKAWGPTVRRCSWASRRGE